MTNHLQDYHKRVRGLSAAQRAEIEQAAKRVQRLAKEQQGHLSSTEAATRLTQASEQLRQILAKYGLTGDGEDRPLLAHEHEALRVLSDLADQQEVQQKALQELDEAKAALDVETTPANLKRVETALSRLAELRTLAEENTKKSLEAIIAAKVDFAPGNRALRRQAKKRR